MAHQSTQPPISSTQPLIIRTGEVVYFKVKTKPGLEVAGRGIVVESGQRCTVAAPPEVMSESSMTVYVGYTKIVFLRLETTCLRLEKPTSWGKVVSLSPWPKVQDAITAFNGLDGHALRGESGDELRSVDPKAVAVSVSTGSTAPFPPDPERWPMTPKQKEKEAEEKDSKRARTRSTPWLDSSSRHKHGWGPIREHGDDVPTARGLSSP
ncbi:unnamed protein product, partial [Polarella glacialis]